MITKTNGFLEEYYQKCKSGEIIVGRELMIELDRLTEDLDNPRYIYDTSDADIRIDFIENCVKLTKSPFYGQPMKLLLFQKAFISALYGFKMADSKQDRFKKTLFLISRKNGKTELVAALVLSELVLGNPGADLVCSGGNDKLASLVYETVDTMRQMIDPESKDIWKNQYGIRNLVTNSKIFKLSEATRGKEGRNIDFASCDESHELLDDNSITKAIEQSQSIKVNPKYIELTTEGFVRGGHLDKQLEYARKIISGEIDDIASERFLPWLFSQDGENEVWQNEKSWVKSNPALFHIKRIEYLREQVELAKHNKSDRAFVLCKDFNIAQNTAHSWLNLEDYDYKAVYKLEDFRGCIALGAVDLSETTDLTCAKVLMMKPNDNTKYIHTMYFIPESKLTDSDDKHAGANYKEWAKKGLITVTEGNDIDLSRVADWFYSLYKEYNIKLWKCGYDQKFAKDFLNRMDFYGWTKSAGELVMIIQNAQTLSNAIKLLEADLTHRLVNFNDNEVDKWCLKNACLKVNDLSQCLIIKSEASKRIDGAVCKAILYEMYRQNRTELREMIEKG